MTTSAARTELALRAVSLARRGYPAPNPHVGCVIVSKGEIVGEGFHEYAGGPHAEAAALAKAGSRAKGSDVYVTLEPCAHQGRTPSCASSLIEAGIKRVFISVLDPNPEASGGADRLRAAGIEVHVGLASEEAEAAMESFLTAHRNKRPFTVLKAASGLDGRIALPDGASQWITGSEARAASHKLRAEAGAVLVGSGTIRTDDPALTVRGIKGVKNQPVRIVLDPLGALDRAKYRTFTAPGDSLRITLPKHGGDIELEAGPRGLIPPSAIQAALFERGLTGLLVEGGSVTLTEFLKERAFDRLVLFVSPKVLGEGISWAAGHIPNALNESLGLRFESVRRLGEDIQLTLRPA